MRKAWTPSFRARVQKKQRDTTAQIRTLAPVGETWSRHTQMAPLLDVHLVERTAFPAHKLQHPRPLLLDRVDHLAVATAYLDGLY